jgi:hypothetical protein
MRSALVLGVAALLALGCGGKKFAPVSGKVTLNGQPLANAHVNFQPVAEKGAAVAGVGSNGQTDAGGQFTLKTDAGQNGALVGKHKVRISVLDPRIGESDERIRPGRMTNRLPDRYNEKTELTFDVPAGGSTTANFDLKKP